MLELLKTRRSIRKFQDRPIEQEKLDEILKSMLLAHHLGQEGLGNLSL